MKEVISPEQATSRCPKCDYDLRGLTEPRCPECGEAFSSQEVAAYAEQRWPPQRLFRTLLLATVPWFVAYIFVDAIHDTLDRVEDNWLTLPFLAFFPLHLVTATMAVGALEASSSRRMKQFGAGLTIIVWFLILGHIVITAWTL